MSYEHDIFISYRHECSTTPWLIDVFLVQLRRKLCPARVDTINIFDDRQIRVSSSWKELLHKKVATSRLLLPVLTPHYFGSDWCRRELALMLEREKILGFRSREQPERGLIIPITVFDGEKFPTLVKDIQIADFRYYTDLRRGTRKWFDFLDQIARLADQIDKVLDESPPFEPAWMDLTGEEIEPWLKIAPARPVLPRLVP